MTFWPNIAFFPYERCHSTGGSFTSIGSVYMQAGGSSFSVFCYTSVDERQKYSHAMEIVIDFNMQLCNKGYIGSKEEKQTLIL